MPPSTRATFPVTVHIILQQDDNVLLLKRQGTGYRDGWYSLVAGHVERGEMLIQAAVREVEEEVGLILEPEALTPIGVMHRRSNDQRIDFFLTANQWRGSPANRETAKASEVGWFALAALPEATIPYIRRALALGMSPFWIDEFGWDSTDD